jgi:hypothetical protein
MALQSEFSPRFIYLLTLSQVLLQDTNTRQYDLMDAIASWPMQLGRQIHKSCCQPTPSSQLRHGTPLLTTCLFETRGTEETLNFQGTEETRWVRWVWAFAEKKSTN